MEHFKYENGVVQPMIGIGTDRVRDSEICLQEIRDAFDVGYRMVDTAQFYDNEQYIGHVISESGIDRSELFVSTKLWYANYEGDNPRKTLMESMKRLHVEYLDRVLLHWPYGNYHHAWRELEKMYDEGLIRVIGVSNMNPDRFMDLCAYSRIKPMVNQIETNILYQSKVGHEWMNKYGIRHEAYSPLGLGRNGIFELPDLVSIAEKYNKTPAQICLKFLIENGISIVPKSIHKDRMIQNSDLFDFHLTEEEMKTLAALDKNLPAIGNAADPVWAEHMLSRINENF